MPDTQQPWPPHLDALVAAPEHHRLLMENEFVRVLETRIEPGQKTAVHTHEWPATYYVLSWSHFVRRDGEGNVTVDSREKNIMLEPGTAAWSESLPPHSFENVGDAPVHIVSFELKNR